MDKNPFRENDEMENQDNTIEENETSKEEENLENENTEQEELTKEDSEENIKENDKEDSSSKYEDLNNKYIRLAADFDNFRKRTAAEKEELANFAKGEVLKKLTVVLDTFDRAYEHLKDIEDCAVVKDGYEVAFKQLTDTLTKIGMTEIDALGKEFNPMEHEAITQVETDEFAPDTVAMVVQKGYKLEDKVIRPALVGVAKAKE